MVDVSFDPAEVRKLVADLKELEGGKALTAALRKNLRQAADPIKRQVQASASWSTRIPAAVAVGTAFSAKRTGVFLKVNSKRAPHARPFENSGKAGTFRHLTFGNEPWVSQQARPSLFNTADRNMPAVELAAAEAVEEAARSAGFR